MRTRPDKGVAAWFSEESLRDPSEKGDAVGVATLTPTARDGQKHHENSAAVTAKQRGSFTAALLVESLKTSCIHNRKLN